MDETVKDVWPDGVPATLWNYDLLQAATPQRLPLPLMGVRPDWNFQLAFLFGALVIVVFAWQRFRQRSFDPSSFDYHVLHELAPTQLRGTGPMRRAYLYYAGTMLFIYTALTFFGELIFSAVNTIPVAGLQVDINRGTLTSPQWPLILAFAIAGFTPLLRPLEVGETWLRQRVHRWVGIPVRIKERTRKLLDALDKEIADDKGARKLLSDNEKRIPDWIKAHAKFVNGVPRMAQKWTQVQLMAAMIADKKAWPDIAVSDDLRPLVEKETDAAEAALDSFGDLLTASYDLSATANNEAEEHARRHLPPNDPGEQQHVEDKRGDGSSATTGHAAEKHARHHRQLEVRLKDATEQLDRAREELGAILTVYAERDRDYARIPDSTIKRVLTQTFHEDARLDADFWVLVLLFPVFLLYVCMVVFDLHLPLTDTDKNAVTVSATAALETLRIAALFWLPLCAVLMWRQYLIDNKRWERSGPRKHASRILAILFLTLVAALFGLAVLTMLWMFVIADNPARFRQLLFGGPRPAFAYFLSQALGALVFVPMTVVAAEAFDKSRSGARAAGLGIAAAIAVSLAMLLHLLFWELVNCNGDDCPAIVLSDFGAFSRAYGLTDFVVYSAVALLTAGLFVRPVRAVQKSGSGGSRRQEKERPQGARPAIGVAAGMALLSLSVLAVYALLPASSHAASFERPKVIVGFRADAEPFSYSVGSGEERTFKGYIADLCYSIFDSSGYELISVEVSAEDRFTRLRADDDETGAFVDPEDPKTKVDILCDPTTLRFDAEVADTGGIFSPIVFASGVSYLMRNTRMGHPDSFLAFVKNTTARKVARQACLVDRFGIRSDPGNCVIENDCATKDNPFDLKQEYFVCVFKNHTELIRWFCAAGRSWERRVYFGDQEIIRSKLAAWRETHGCPYEIEPQHVYYTYEPYALLVSSARPELAQFVQQRIYEFFSHRSKALSLFRTYFPGSQMSPTVANLFLLNAVEEETKFSIPRPLGQTPHSRAVHRLAIREMNAVALASVTAVPALGALASDVSSLEPPDPAWASFVIRIIRDAGNPDGVDVTSTPSKAFLSARVRGAVIPEDETPLPGDIAFYVRGAQGGVVRGVDGGIVHEVGDDAVTVICAGLDGVVRRERRPIADADLLGYVRLGRELPTAR
ncbi:hypothetical protein [Sinorhizobium meliloti]|uniref:hypothetical protein n=1 Tax=Rhizobium meliloti TaxID=382 RepID=UPI000FD6C7E2|nr:hypothetical protein [Sinorhizobium meliloti]MQX41090.1 hypothetical protein [Sinorhizobium meliloti]RVI51961.1 hypothetical protein CN195_12470 [Sinorhizobium meliloti]